MLPRVLSEPIITVRVLDILPFGLLVGLDNGRTGVVREREIAWRSQDRKHWREQFHPGDILQAVQLDENRHPRLEFSLRMVRNDPWVNLATRYEVGQLVEGVVMGVQPYAAFVEIEPGVTGFLHRSRMPGALAKTSITDVLWPGDRVQVVIELINPSKRRLRLSLSHAMQQRWKHSTVPQPNANTETRSRQLDIDSGAQSIRLPLDLLLARSVSRAILVVEDDEMQREAVVKWLQQAGQHTVAAMSAEEGLSKLERESFEFVFMDFGLPQMDGIQALQQVHARQPESRCILMTDWARANEHVDALAKLSRMGAQLLIKPFLPEDLLDILLAAVPVVDDTAAQIMTTTIPIPASVVPTQSPEQVRIEELVHQLSISTAGLKVVLFALDVAQRKIQIVAEAGSGELHRAAITDLIYSPVRDVAEDRQRFWVEDAQHAESRVRYLKPLLVFRSCLGLPIPGDLPERYALFLFDTGLRALVHTYEAHTRATTIAISTILEHQRFRAHASELQRLALLGQLSRALIHEVNHHLSPINFALSDLGNQCAALERTVVTAADNLEGDIREVNATLTNLATGVRRLTKTTRLFGQVTTQRQEEPVSPYAIAAEVLDLVRDLADRAQVTMGVQALLALTTIRVPAAQVQQILLNIVINAIQQIALADPHNGGHIQIWITEHPNHQNSLQIKVEDDGPGVHRRLWERIFELGFTTRHEGGSGLGLYITRSLVESLGGKVYVMESYITWGTTLCVELPVKI